MLTFRRSNVASIQKSSCLVVVRQIGSRPINSFTDVLEQVLHLSNPNRHLNVDATGVSQRKELIGWNMLICKGMSVSTKLPWLLRLRYSRETFSTNVVTSLKGHGNQLLHFLSTQHGFFASQGPCDTQLVTMP